MNKHIISLAKAATIVASAAVFLSYKNRRDLRESILSYKSAAGELAATFIVTAAGTAVAMLADQLNENKYPNRAEKLQKADDKLIAYYLSKVQENKDV